MPSMDIVSEINIEEVRNAAENATRELSSRFDFRGVDASIEWKKPNVEVNAEGDFQVKQLVDMVRTQLTKRKVDPQSMTVGEPEFSGRKCKAICSFKEGIDQPTAKKIVKLIKDSKLKVQAAIQGEQVRVTGKKRDDLQSVMRLVKEAELEQSFQFTNFRD